MWRSRRIGLGTSIQIPGSTRVGVCFFGFDFDAILSAAVESLLAIPIEYIGD